MPEFWLTAPEDGETHTPEDKTHWCEALQGCPPTQCCSPSCDSTSPTAVGCPALVRTFSASQRQSPSLGWGRGEQNGQPSWSDSDWGKQRRLDTPKEQKPLHPPPVILKCFNCVPPKIHMSETLSPVWKKVVGPLRGEAWWEVFRSLGACP